MATTAIRPITRHYCEMHYRQTDRTTETLTRLMHHCLSNGDEEGVLALLRAGADITKDVENTPFMINLFDIGKYELASRVMFLGLETLGADIPDENDDTLLTRAIEDDLDEHFIRSVIHYTRDVNHINGEGKTALMLAMTGKKFSVLQDLIKAGADTNITNTADRKALEQLSDLNEATVLDVIKILMTSDNFNPNQRLRDGITPLSRAIHAKDLELTLQLIQRGAHISLDNLLDLFTWAESEDPSDVYGQADSIADMIEEVYGISFDDMLTDLKPFLYIKDKMAPEDLEEILDSENINKIVMGRTPLIYAVEKARSDLIYTLYQQGANPNQINYEGKRAIDFLEYFPTLRVGEGLELLLTSDEVDLCELDYRNWPTWFSPLLWGVGTFEVVKNRLINAKENCPDTFFPIHTWISEKDYSPYDGLIMEWMKNDLGFDMNAKDDGGITPIQLAIALDKPEWAEYLYTKGASLKGLDPLDIKRLKEKCDQDDSDSESSD